MDVWKYEIISRVEQDISLVRFAHSWDILDNARNKFHISAHPCIILYVIVLTQCRLRHILYIIRVTLNFNNRNIIFNPLSTKISSKKLTWKV